MSLFEWSTAAEIAHAERKQHQLVDTIEIIGCTCGAWGCGGTCEVCQRYSRMTIAEAREYNRRQKVGCS